MKNIYAYGMISQSTLVRLEGVFPSENGYAEIADTHMMVSGETGNSSQVLSNWGYHVKVDGPWLGDNSANFVSQYLKDRNIDATRLHHEINYQGIEEIVLSVSTSRTVLGGYKRLLFTTKQWNDPCEEDIQWADLVSIDPQFGNEALLAAKLAKKHNKPLLGIDCRFDDEILQFFDTIVIGDPYLQNWYGDRDRNELFEIYSSRFKGLLIFTMGEKPLWFSRNGKQKTAMDVFSIMPVDTTGAGDTFRAGLAHGMLSCWDDLEMLKFSAAAAALNCMKFPGVQNAPALHEIDKFMKNEG